MGTHYDLVCAECTPAELTEVCESCADRADQKSFPSGWHGEPEVLLRDRELGGTWSARPCPVRPLNDGCLAPMPGHWLALTAEGFVRITDDDQWLVGPVELPEETHEDIRTFPDRPRRGLHTSRDGRFAAVVYEYGQFATVVDLDEWVTVLDLDRDWNDNELTRFPLAFLGEGETAKVVAGTDWNRLDVFALPGGEQLTDRVTAAPPHGEPEPEHYLDYFQGALHPSPSERWLVTDGWVWHPIGAPQAVDLATWLGGDRHAAEQARGLTPGRENEWDQPIAWLDDTTVAIQRMGTSWRRMLDGVELYDAETGRRTGMFAGPAGRMWAHGGLLYVAAEAGLEVWDPAEGARIGLLEGFAPIAHDPASGAFAELRNDQLRTWTTPR
ncbi:hypothetical protein [Amycolatopsis sp. lyj-346]|uniref:hypothetical protein n=1 Tax=Amycolatopsis sp. lyj-346 TaxID=2789289 RepID=UPI00397D1193